MNVLPEFTKKYFKGLLNLVGYLVQLGTVGKMEKTIRARQWDREWNVLNTENFL